MPISNTIIRSFTNYIARFFSNDEIERIVYVMQCYLWEIEKLIYLSILFALQDKLILFLTTYIILMSVRFNSDGIHFDSSVVCFLVTYSLFFLSINILPDAINMNSTVFIFLSVISLIIFLALAPMSDPPAHNPMARKVLTLIIVLVWLAVIATNIKMSFALAGFWIIHIQSFQLVIEYFRRKKVITWTK